MGFSAELWHNLAQMRRVRLARLGLAAWLVLAGACFGGPHPVPPGDGRPVIPVGAAGTGSSTGEQGGRGGGLDSGGGGRGGPPPGAAGTGAAGAGPSLTDAGGAECDAGQDPAEGDAGLNCEDDGDGGFVAR